jgi:hypothetical protein
MSSSSSNRPRRSSRRAATGGAGTAAPKRSATARRRSEDPYGKKIHFEDMETETRYLAVEKKTVTKGMTQNVLSGEFDGVYEPDGSVRAPSSKPYVVMKAGRNEKDAGFLSRVYHIRGSALVPLDGHVEYLNDRHPEREVILSTAHWDFYPMPVMSPAKLVEKAPYLSDVPPHLLSKISEFINPFARR